MSWFEKLMPSRISTEKRTRSVPEGVWIKCERCDAQLYRAELERNLQVCPKCDHHFLMGCRDRVELLADPGSFEETEGHLVSANPLGFNNYEEKVAGLREKTQLNDAVLTGRATVMSCPAAPSDRARLPGRPRSGSFYLRPVCKL